MKYSSIKQVTRFGVGVSFAVLLGALLLVLLEGVVGVLQISSTFSPLQATQKPFGLLFFVGVPALLAFIVLYRRSELQERKWFEDREYCIDCFDLFSHER